MTGLSRRRSRGRVPSLPSSEHRFSGGFVVAHGGDFCTRKSHFWRKPELTARRLARQVSDTAPDELNPHGGTIALGHPYGMSGARIMCALLTELETMDRTVGLETMCGGWTGH
jgi:acetyl-CoA acetyltransferase